MILQFQTNYFWQNLEKYWFSMSANRLIIVSRENKVFWFGWKTWQFNPPSPLFPHILKVKLSVPNENIFCICGMLKKNKKILCVNEPLSFRKAILFKLQNPECFLICTHYLFWFDWFELFCLTPLSTIFQLYHGEQV